MKVSSGTLRGVFIVRDAQGRVKFDDWGNIPEAFHPHLTDADWAYIKERANGDHTQHGGA